MKKILFTIGVCMLFLAGIHSSQAQTSIIFGPEAGINFSKMTFTNDFDFADDYSRVMKIQGGLSGGVQFGMWGVVTGVKFNQKGGKATLERRDPNNPFLFIDADGNIISDVGKITVKESTNWISVPLLARARFGQGDIKFGIAIGPQFNFGIGKYKEEIEYDLTVNSPPKEEQTSTFGDSATDIYKGMHLSLVINPTLWYDLNPNSSLKFGIMFEAGADMVNKNFLVSNANGDFQKINATAKSSNFGIMIGYEHRFDINVGVRY